MRVASILDDGQTFHDKRTPKDRILSKSNPQNGSIYAHHHAPLRPQSSWFVLIVVVFVERVGFLQALMTDV